MWDSITAGIISNLIFLIATVFVAYLLVMILRRRRLYRFFGIGEEKKVTIYISHFNIVAGGAKNAYGNTKSFTGRAIPHSEMAAAQRLSEVFSLPFPGLGGQHGILSAFRLSDIRCQIIPSPFSEAEISLDHTIICVGSHGYNTASNLLQKQIQDKVVFAPDGLSIQIRGLPPITNAKQGVVARFSSDRVRFFYLAGLSEMGTASAIIYLRKHWAKLHQAYVNSPSFYVLCEAKGGDIESVAEVNQGTL